MGVVLHYIRLRNLHYGGSFKQHLTEEFTLSGVVLNNFRLKNLHYGGSIKQH